MRRNSKESKTSPVPIEGRSSAGCRAAVVASRFNVEVVDRLLAGALEVLQASGVRRDDVLVARVPGAFELPLAASRLAASGRFDAVIALGCVVRGQTRHFEYLSRATADGLQRVALDSGVPIGFGVLTTETIEEAIARAGGDEGNRGSDAARASLEMIDLLRHLEEN